ncbi:MAG: hypothetical protein CL676_12080 [Bdellovibrionaceae bacterium]|nr:hypothetical protein [Pseudobdellovibrionaceae bacterium]|tara:strand:- start:261 stop:1253 length:993 start_codon:yes stop_codon:yes gene_type:complete
MKALLVGIFLLWSAHAFSNPRFEKLAEEQFANAQYREAIDTLSKDAERLTEKGYLILAASYSEIQEYDNELRILGILSSKDSGNYQWKMLIGQSHLKKSRFSKIEKVKKDEETKAIQSFRETLQSNPKFKPAYDQLLEIFLQREESHEARTLLASAIQQFGPRAQWLNKLCELQANDGFLGPAETTCRRAIQISPNFPDNYVFLSQSLMDQKEEGKAQKVAMYSGKRFPSSEFAQWGAGQVFLLIKNFEAAIKYFGNAIHVNSESMRAHLGEAEALFQSGEQSRALGHFKKACDLGARNSEKLHVRAAELRIKGDEDLGNKYRSLAETCR